MGHAHGCGCFPTGQVYPGIATLKGSGPPPVIGLANDLPVNDPLSEVALADAAAWRAEAKPIAAPVFSNAEG